MMELITLYLDQTPQLVIDMNKSLDEKDWTALYAAVHKMIPSFIVMGISADFEDIARKVQDLAHLQQQSDTIPDLVLQLTNACTQSCIELKEEYNTIKSLQQS